MAMPRERLVDEVEARVVIDPSPRPVVGWGGVFSGFVVGAGVVVILTVLGIAVGVTAVPEPRTIGGETTGRLGIGAGIWAALSLLVGFFVAGVVSTRATNHPDRVGALIHGMLVWMLGIITATALVTSGIGVGVAGLFQGLGLLTRGAIVSGLATATGASADEAARALDDLRARVAEVRDDPARVAAEVQTFFERFPERVRAQPPTPDDAAAVQRGARVGAWITLGTLLITLLVTLLGALTGAARAERLD
jgi:hypothetical protein